MSSNNGSARDPWISNNGLRVESRSAYSFKLNWSKAPEKPAPKPKFRYGTPRREEKEETARDGLEGPWYELQIRTEKDDYWETIYKGYQTHYTLKNLTPNSIYLFRLRQNGDEGWGSIVTAATDNEPPNALDIHRAVNANAPDMLLRIIGFLKQPRLRLLLQSHDSSGMTPLMMAAKNGHFDIVTILCAAGAWINARSVYNKRTALMYACASGELKIVKYLDDQRADWSFVDYGGLSPLEHAVNSNKLAVVQFTVHRMGGQAVLRKDRFGWDPLIRCAAIGATAEIARFLLDTGADPNAMDRSKSKTALIAAVISHREDLVKLLLSRGADPTKANDLGKTPYDVASGLGYYDLCEHIVQHLTNMASGKETVSVRPYPVLLTETDLPLTLSQEQTQILERRAAEVAATTILEHASEDKFTNQPTPSSVQRIYRESLISFRRGFLYHEAP